MVKKAVICRLMLFLCAGALCRCKVYDKNTDGGRVREVRDMELYQQFINLDIDFSRIGFFAQQNRYRYFCTPENGYVIGSLGVDGVHYCTVDGCGDMIFAVNPIPAGDVYVYPVAKDFGDFLGLILATGSTNALDQIYYMGMEDYDSMMAAPDNAAFLTAPQHMEILQKIEALGVQPVENPFEYVKNLQAEFDCSKIVYSDEFYATVP